MSSTKQINLNQIKKMEKQMKNTLKEITKKSIDNLYQGDVKEHINYWFGEMVALGYTMIKRRQTAPKNMVEKFHILNDKNTSKVKQVKQGKQCKERVMELCPNSVYSVIRSCYDDFGLVFMFFLVL